VSFRLRNVPLLSRVGADRADYLRTDLDAARQGWAQAVLKFVLAHPAVSCVIPATTQVAHVRQNLGAMAGPLPDAALARRIGAHIRAL
jgi:aryl-alcohol dehydrogenase-like predicted oxidoreductase